MAAEKTGLEGAVPILRVRDLAASVEFYVNVLGFRKDWGDLERFCSVSRDRSSIMLCQNDQGCSGTWLWVGAEDAEALFREFSAAGAKIPLPPTNYPWALEFHVQDPDGHVLRFGSEPKEDRPFSKWVAWNRQ
jgi:predicted lactoylglutathione lyase